MENRKKKKAYKKAFYIAVALSLAFAQAAYAEVVVPPKPGHSTAPPSQPAPPAQPGPPADTGGDGGGAQPGQGAGSPALLQEPEIKAEGAVLLDGATGKVLFGKNQDQPFYPASITKVMTALLVLERCPLDDVVTFSSAATTNLEAGAVSLDITQGDQLTVEQCLYGLLLKSANEIGNGLAEHVAGSIDGFAGLMNERAAQLGCQNTHFANPHGLNNSSHKTSPHDMALIMRAALQNETFRRIDTTRSYEFPATKKASARTITMGHKMMDPSDSRYYEGVVGGKTGFTSLAGNTLVTGAERDGVQLVAVVMKASQTHYTDTRALLDYGFANYGALAGGGPKAEAPDLSGDQQNPGGAIGAQKPQNPAGPSDGHGKPVLQSPSGGTGAQGPGGPALLGWQKSTGGLWRYYAPDTGHEVKSQWIQDGGFWYYLGGDGVMLSNTFTPDGYWVDESGKWIQ